jgi:hypothetical protein
MMVALATPNTSRIALYYTSDDGPAGTQQCVNETAAVYITITYL